MNLFVADPDWGWWIITYFYLGGIAAGAYFTATLLDLWGGPAGREIARRGYWLAFPLVAICGVVLILDLHRPERFWHMLFKSEVVRAARTQGWPFTAHSWGLMLHAPLLKYWSPMSLGSWALSLFGLCSGLSFLANVWPGSRVGHVLRDGMVGRALQLVGCGVGLFVGAYTGALLTATNQPIWSESDWVASLFLASSASTGIAALMLLWASANAVPGLARAELWVIGLEFIIFLIFVASLGALRGPIWTTAHGKVLFLAVPALAMLIPLVISLLPALHQSRAGLLAAASALLGGLLLRYVIVTTPSEILARGPQAFSELVTETAGSPLIADLSPEDGRKPGESLGADPLNRADPSDPAKIVPRTKEPMP